MQVPPPKNSLEAAYRLVVDIAELLLIHNAPKHQFTGSYPLPTPSKAETELELTATGELYQPDPDNASVVPSDVLNRLAAAIADLEEIEESYWENQ